MPLTIPVPILEVERKITLDFYFYSSFLCASKGFMKALNAFIKPFEAPQKSVKMEIYVNFYFNESFCDSLSGKVTATLPSLNIEFYGWKVREDYNRLPLWFSLNQLRPSMTNSNETDSKKKYL